MKFTIIVIGVGYIIIGALTAAGILSSNLDVNTANIVGAILVGAGVITFAIGAK
ncbi:MAG: hypothetical protein KKD44_27030 [Proteobacteria bacterium]|nr:hypothetical protein [Pseudomonadota bacterium]